MNQAEAAPEREEDGEVRALVGEARALLDQGRAYACAELAYQKSRATFAGRELGGIAVLGVLAAFCLFLALFALTAGTLAALVPRARPWGATAAVTGALVGLTALFAALAVGRLARMRRALADHGANDGANDGQTPSAREQQ